MKIYNTLLTASGLSLREAAAIHNVRLDTVKSWSSGRRDVPGGVIDEIYSLVSKQIYAAQQGAAQILKIISSQGAPENIELGVCADDNEALSIGWPTVSAHKVVIGLTIANLPLQIANHVVVVPRGSTPVVGSGLENH